MGLAIALSGLSLKAQVSTGIEFAEDLSWPQILQKAKAEHKGIFIDCYATWCGPCKQMDAEVYPQPEVGVYMNPRFLSVKIQMDRTPADGEVVKNWYGTATMLANAYHINAFPTFLYLDENGKPMHRHVGSGTVKEFIGWAKEAQDTTKQYYAILRHYVPGKLDTAEVKGLALGSIYSDPKLAGQLFTEYLQRGGWQGERKRHSATFIDAFAGNSAARSQVEQLLNPEPHDLKDPFFRNLLIAYKGDPAISRKAVSAVLALPATDLADPELLPLLAAYKDDRQFEARVAAYLGSINDQALSGKNVIALSAAFPMSIPTNSRVFNFYLIHRSGSNMTEGLIDAVLNKQLIIPLLQKADSLGTEPDWQAMQVTLNRLTSSGNAPVSKKVSIAERNILNAKTRFYKVETAKAEKKNGQDKERLGGLFANALARQTEILGFDTTGSLGTIFFGNDIERSIYRYSNDLKAISEALNWLDIVMRYRPGTAYSYVYAGLLYKLGKTDAAIQWQQMTVQLLEADRDRRKVDLITDREYQEQSAILEKMKKKAKFGDLIFWWNG